MKLALRIVLVVLLSTSACGFLSPLPSALAQDGKKPEKIPLQGGKAKVESSIKESDEKDKVQKFQCKIFTFDLKKGQLYKIDMVSKDLDSYLRLEDESGKQLAKDDDGGGLVNARINFYCRADGAYRIICTTFNSGTGPFTLTVQEIPIAKAANLDLKDGMAKVDAKLTDKDATDILQTHSVCKIYAIKLVKGKSYQIDMMSKDIDSYLRLEDPTGQQLAKDDDSGDGRNARIQFTCPEDGEYRIVATTYFGGLGNFTVTIKEK
ncbi:MAG TPA: pre-peptidase C-terminal domain-containing protein [Gemmataceae bacterium]|nr:pre-peptidase C-terminal domain-containing protein [Gemmataceae bacterium]